MELQSFSIERYNESCPAKKETSKLTRNENKYKRYKQQTEALVELTTNIHGKGKEAFIDSLAYNIESVQDSDLKWQLKSTVLKGG